MNDAFIAINVTTDRGILNTSGAPIILYLNSEDDIKSVISNNEEFENFIVSSCKDVHDYLTGKIETISVEFESENNDLDEFLIEDIFDLSHFEHILEEIVKEVFNDLYNYVHKKDYDFDKLLSVEENLKSLYKEIEDIYKDKMQSNTAYHYFISEIKKKYDFLETNQGIISKYIKNILSI